MPIITTAEYKVHIGESGTGYDSAIDVYIAAVQADLERACSRVFNEATYTDQAYSGNGEPNLWLRNYPVSAVSAVKTLSSDGTTTTLAATDYRLVDAEYLHRISSSDFGWGYPPLGSNRGPCWPEGDGNLLVTYTGGFSDEDMPDDLKRLMYELVDAAMDRRGENWTLSQAADGIKQRTMLTGKMYAEAKAELIRPWVRGVV
jgi:hypothetical protein